MVLIIDSRDHHYLLAVHDPDNPAIDLNTAIYYRVGVVWRSYVLVVGRPSPQLFSKIA